MPRITPLSVDELTSEARAVLDYAGDSMRFVPNDAPLDFARKTLRPADWTPGKHAPAE